MPGPAAMAACIAIRTILGCCSGAHGDAGFVVQGQASDTALVTVHDLRLDSAEIRRLYGPGVIVMDRLAFNYVQRREGTDRAMSQRFRMPYDGRIESIRIFSPDGPEGEYASGTGGVVQIRIFPDDGTPEHRPAMDRASLGSADYVPHMRKGRHLWRGQLFPTVRIEAAADMKAGTLYHIVYEQVDDDPVHNYANINSITGQQEGNQSPSRWLSPVDWGVLFGRKPEASDQPYHWLDASREGFDGMRFVPFVQINMESGSNFGATILESGNQAPRLWDVSADTPIRERFRPIQARTVSGLSFSAAASVAGELHWALRQGDRSLAQGTIRQQTANFRLISSGNYRVGAFQWYDVALTEPVSLRPEVDYDLVFTPIGAARWTFAAQSNGSQWGFRSPAAYTESQAQHFSKGGWFDVHLADHHSTSCQRTNWHVVLHTRGPE